MDLDKVDPKGLVRESYAMEAISLGECRAIFMDWALSLPEDADPLPPIRMLLGHYGERAPDHPMTAVLRAGLEPPDSPRRRGGRTGRTGA
jgi:hypothetical protein